MFEKFLTENAQDFRQRYEGTYGYFIDRTKNTRVLCNISRLDLDSRPRTVYFEDHRGIEFSVHADATSDVGFEFIPPRSAFYNTENGVYFVQRIATRQFHRGIRHNNTQIFKITSKGWAVCNVRFEQLYAIFEQRLPYGKNAEKLLSEGTEPVAISPEFCINQGVINVFTEKIGVFNNSVIELESKGSLFLPELQKALEACRINTIKVVQKNE